MLFNSLVFLYGFLPVTYAVHFLLRRRSHRYVWLTLASYVFYGFWNYRFVLLMALSTLISYVAGLGMLRWRKPGLRRWLCLVVPVAADLFFLAFFKYFSFGYDVLRSAAGAVDVRMPPLTLHIVLPIGISFYTFHTISYMVDSYRGTITPTRNFFEFSCYVSLFSQLVAGPIVRFAQVKRDLEAIAAHRQTRNLNLACSYFAIGMMKKVLLADSIAMIIDPALQNFATLSTLDTWLCVLGYAYQLYFDFSGYSDMAVGLGHLFNIGIPQNFDSPYKAASIRDFWSRWHMSLSTCLRDYLYIPLGGNRGGPAATYRNLLITMGLGGLWHGASWTFVIWGLYHGILISLQRALEGTGFRIPLASGRIATFLLVLVGWVFFRATSLGMAVHLLRNMFVWQGGAAVPGRMGLLALVALAALVSHLGPNTFEMKHEWSLGTGAGLAALLALAVLVISTGASSPFLYFQF